MMGFEPPRWLAYAKNRSLKGFFNATPPLDAPDKIILCIMMGFEPPRWLAYAKNRSLKGFLNATPPLDAPPRSNTIFTHRNFKKIALVSLQSIAPFSHCVSATLVGTLYEYNPRTCSWVIFVCTFIFSLFVFHFSLISDYF